MCECCNDTMTIEKHEAHDTVELETDDYLAWLAREKPRINAIKSAYIMEVIKNGRVPLHCGGYGFEAHSLFLIFIFGG